MTTAVDTRVPAGGRGRGYPRAESGPAPAARCQICRDPRRARRLVLLINGSVDFWFSYRETKDAASASSRRRRMRRRSASRSSSRRSSGRSAGRRRAMGGGADRAAPLRLFPADAPGAGDHRADPARRPRARSSSRCRGCRWMWSAARRITRQNPGFIEAKAKHVWFGPVYFRKESEPYMTMAMAQTAAMPASRSPRSTSS